jgi:hypothetical protein
MRECDDAIVIVECRHYTTSALKQEHLDALAYRLHDKGSFQFLNKLFLAIIAKATATAVVLRLIGEC